MALAHLLVQHPQLTGLVWTVGETPGVLSARQVAESGQGEIIDVCAAAMGGTVIRSVLNRGDDRQGVAQLVTSFDGVNVEAWASYPLPDDHGLTSADLRELFASRSLGELVCLPGGGGR
ncbi:hypothetical protein HEP81_04568 [Streptomyces griseofuscus]|uniref:Uncharacterized protein n=1 Tax=Streptomyces griseofuscus TaxID=146922 RepID=A0A7H1Q3G1_9ACTN|nr:hypothetical protein [Streptomyces griseofuscus]QNT94841.1 hypothetical protein HEP81_04568 [Streptomyces griseofuscus]